LAVVSPMIPSNLAKCLPKAYLVSEFACVTNYKACARYEIVKGRFGKI
jgi:hypothetical protein